MRKVSVRILKYKLPVQFVTKLIDLAEIELGAKEVGFVHARTQNGLPITRVNFYVKEIDEEKVKEFEKKLLELAAEFGIKPNTIRKVIVEDVAEHEHSEPTA